MDYKHQNHLAKWDVDSGLVFEKHLMFSQNICNVDLVHLNSLDCPIKIQGFQNL